MLMVEMVCQVGMALMGLMVEMVCQVGMALMGLMVAVALPAPLVQPVHRVNRVSVALPALWVL